MEVGRGALPHQDAALQPIEPREGSGARPREVGSQTQGQAMALGVRQPREIRFKPKAPNESTLSRAPTSGTETGSDKKEALGARQLRSATLRAELPAKIGAQPPHANAASANACGLSRAEATGGASQPQRQVKRHL